MKYSWMMWETRKKKKEEEGCKETRPKKEEVDAKITHRDFHFFLNLLPFIACLLSCVSALRLSLVSQSCVSCLFLWKIWRSSKYMQSFPVDPFISLNRDVLPLLLLVLRRLSWHWTIVVVKVVTAFSFLSLIVIQVLPDTMRPSRWNFYSLLCLPPSLYQSLAIVLSMCLQSRGKKIGSRTTGQSLLSFLCKQKNDENKSKFS